VGDGGHRVAGLFRESLHDIDMMARCARNRALYELPVTPGRRRCWLRGGLSMRLVSNRV
jgi:hypothetical protein